MDWKNVKSYDYFEDDNGWIYLFKGVILSKEKIVGSPVYTPGTNRLKVKTFSEPHLKLSAKKTSLSMGNEREIPFGKVKKLFRNSEALHSLHPAIKGHKFLQSFIEIMSSLGLTVRLFGSRQLGIETPQSDWDFLVSGTDEPKIVVEKLISKFAGQLRLFNSVEIDDRVSRYALDEPWANKNLLGKIFSKSTLYLKSPVGELGLFFEGSSPNKLPNEVLNGESKDMAGRFLKSSGKSFHMPREFLVESDGEVQKILTISWALGGVEELEGCQVQFSGLRKIGERTWWFGCNGSDIYI